MNSKEYNQEYDRVRENMNGWVPEKMSKKQADAAFDFAWRLGHANGEEVKQYFWDIINVARMN